MKKLPSFIKDGLVGFSIGTASLIPGISGGTMAYIFGSYQKLTHAIGNIFKNFWKNLLILLPFVIGIIVSLVGLYFPLHLAFEHFLFAIIVLFGGFIIGSFPNIIEPIRHEKITASNVIIAIICFVIAAIIGVFSVIFDFGSAINSLFDQKEWYLYIIIFFVGIIGAAGLIVPGISGSMILLVIGFYFSIFALPSNILKGEAVLENIILLAIFALGVAVGFLAFSKLMDFVLTKYRTKAGYAILGFIAGSLISIFCNSEVFAYLNSKPDLLLDIILSPIFLIIGIAASLTIYFISKKKKKEETKNATN